VNGKNLTSVLALVTVGTAVVTACGSSGGGAAAPAGGSGSTLSQSSISIGGSTAGDFGLTWIADKAGFFKQQGLTVKFVNFSAGTGSTSGITSAFLGHSFDFLNNPATATLFAKQAGAPITAVASVDEGSQNQIAISDAAAARLHIPAADGTPAEATKQLLALKGSHITIGVTGTSSTSYTTIAALLQLNGLTYGVNAPGKDVDFVTTGTANTQVAGFLAGKFDAIASTPPQTTKPDTVVISLGLIPPVAQGAGLYLATLDSFAQAHPDTVQAVVNAEVEAWAYAKKNPAAAEKLMVSMYAENGVTDPAAAASLFAVQSKYWETPVMSQAAYNSAVKVINLGSKTPISLGFSSWCDDAFVDKAIKNPSLTLGQSVPAT
jgi:ABC-type nitrate/sulfonate/bicarbonate transport system substrate-binding protein